MIYNSAKNTFYELFTLNKIFTILIVIFINFSHNSHSSELDNLFFKLKQSTNPTLAMDYEAKIWNLWINNGSTESNNSQMQKGLELLQNGKLDKALLFFKKLSKKEPVWAEPINKIATIKFLQGDYIGSINDIKLTLKLEPRHFGALAGQGLVNIQLKNFEKAIRSYKQAQEIYPSMRSPEIMIKQIEDLMKEQTI